MGFLDKLTGQTPEERKKNELEKQLKKWKDSLWKQARESVYNDPKNTNIPPQVLEYSVRETYEKLLKEKEDERPR